MRFYALELYAPQTTKPSIGVILPNGVQVTPTKQIINPASTPSKVWTSFPNGQYDATAQNIQFDILTYKNSVSAEYGYVITVEGVSYQDIQAHNNFKGYYLKLYAGMEGGLPLSANQPTPGLILQSRVFQGIGNWVGTDMTLSLVCYSDPFTPKNPGPLVLNWQAGQTLSQALAQCFSTAYPTVPQDFQISPNLVQGFPTVHRASDLTSLATWLGLYTTGILGPTYEGVSLYWRNGGIYATDGTQPSDNTVQIKFDDLIGQPVIVEKDYFDIVTPLRADIQTGDQIELSVFYRDQPGLAFENALVNNATLNYTTTFQGKFRVLYTRQIGNFRADNAELWSTVIRCAGLSTPTSADQQ